MRLVVQVIAGLGVVTFLISVIIRVANTPHILGASSQGWWRASVSLFAMGILYALLEITNELRKRAT